MSYNRSFDELEQKAEKWWPAGMAATVAAASPIPILLESQDKFIDILNLSGQSPSQVFDVLAASRMSPNLFLKHLVILADYGGEPLKRLGSSFRKIFALNDKTRKFAMNYVFRETKQTYHFECLPVSNLGNPALNLDGPSLINEVAMSPLYKDMIMILLHGATSDVAQFAALDKCEIGTLLGDDLAINKYVREKYIHVSRITTGATSNSLGQIAQTYVADTLREMLPKYKVLRNSSISLTGYDKPGGMPFDIVVQHGNKKVGIEVSFQVTTNSTIERKGGQADSRYQAMHKEGHWIAYVIDGAGNFARASAVKTICKFSDCTVTYSRLELEHLAKFIEEKLQ